MPTSPLMLSSSPSSGSATGFSHSRPPSSPSLNSPLASPTIRQSSNNNNKKSSSNKKRSPSPSPSFDSPQQRSILEKHKHIIMANKNSNKSPTTKSKKLASSKNRRKHVLELWKSAEKSIIEKSLYSSVARVPFSLDRLSDFREFFLDDLGMYDRELSEEEFIDIFQEALAGRRFSREELSHWFKDIDVDCGESVSWDEFSTFVLTQTKIEQKLARDMDRARDFVPDITYPLSTSAHHKHLSEHLITLGTPKFQGLPDGSSATGITNSSSSPTSHKNAAKNKSASEYSTGLLSILTASSDGQIKFWTKPQHDIHEASGRPANEPHFVCGFENFSSEIQGVNSTSSSASASSAIMNLIRAKKQQSSESSSSPSSKNTNAARNKSNVGGMKYSPIVDFCVAGEGTDGHFFVLGSDRTVNVFNGRTHKIAIRYKGYPTAASRFIRATLGTDRGVFASEPRDGVPLVRMLDMNDFPSSICVARVGHFASTAARDPNITFQGDEVFFFGMQSGDVLVYVTERHTIRALRNPLKIFGKEIVASSSSSSEPNNNNNTNSNDDSDAVDPLLNTDHKIIYSPKLHSDRIHKIHYSPLFGGLITVSWDGTMRITDPENGKTNFSFDCVNHRFSPSFDYDAPQTNKKNARFYHAGGVPVTTCGFGSGAEDIDLIDLKHTNPICDFALNERDHLIATAAGEHQCLLWSPAIAAHPIGVLRSPRSKIVAVCFASDQCLAITLDQVGGVVRIWDLRKNTQRQMFYFKDHESAPPEARLEIPRRISFEPRTGTLVAVKRSPMTWTIRRRIAASSIHNDAILTTCLVDSASNGGWIFSCDAQEVAAFSIQKGTKKLMIVPFQHVDSSNDGRNHLSGNQKNNQPHYATAINSNNKKMNDYDDFSSDKNSTVAHSGGQDVPEQQIDDDQMQNDMSDIKNPIAAIGLDRHERRIYFCSKDGLIRVFNARTGMFLSQMRPRHYHPTATTNTTNSTRNSASSSSSGPGDVVAVVPLTSGDMLVRIVAVVASTEIHFVWDSFDPRLGTDVHANKNKSHRVLKLEEQIPPCYSSSSSSSSPRIPKILHALRGLDPDDRSFVPYMIVGLDDGRIVLVNAITTSVTLVLRGSDKTIFNSAKARQKFERDRKNTHDNNTTPPAQQQQALDEKTSTIELDVDDPNKHHPLHNKKQHHLQNKPKFIELQGAKSAPEQLIDNHMAEKETAQMQLNEGASGEMRIEDMVLIRSKDLLIVVFENSPLVEMWNVRLQHHIVSRVTWPVNMVPRGISCIFNTDENEKTEMLQQGSGRFSRTNSNSNNESGQSSPRQKKKTNAKPPAPCFTAVTCDGRGEVMFCGDTHGCIYIFDVTAINPLGSCPHWLRSGASYSALAMANEQQSNNNNNNATSGKSRSPLLDTGTKKKAFFSSIARRAGLAAKQERIHEMRKLAARKPKNVGPQTICIRLLKVFRAHSDAILKLTYSDSSQRLISQGADLVVKCFTGIGKEIGFFGPPEPFHSANLSDLYKDQDFLEKQKQEQKEKMMQEQAESAMAKEKRLRDLAEKKRQEKRKRKEERRKTKMAQKKLARSRSPTPINNNNNNNSNDNDDNQQQLPPALSLVSPTLTAVVSGASFVSEEEDGSNNNIIMSEASFCSSPSLSSSSSSSSDDDDDYDETGNKTLRGCAVADPLIQSAILTPEEIEDCPELVMIERIALVYPEDEIDDNILSNVKKIPDDDDFFNKSMTRIVSPTTQQVTAVWKTVNNNNNDNSKMEKKKKKKRDDLPPGEEYYTVQNFNVDEVHGSFDYSQFLTKVTSREFVEDRRERSGVFSASGSRSGGGIMSKLLSSPKKEGSSSGSPAASADFSQQETTKEKDDNDELVPSMSLVKASTLMLRSMNKRRSTTTEEKLTVSLPTITTTPPTHTASPPMTSSTTPKTKFASSLAKFAAASSSFDHGENDDDDEARNSPPPSGFFMTQTDSSNTTGSKTPQPSRKRRTVFTGSANLSISPSAKSVLFLSEEATPSHLHHQQNMLSPSATASYSSASAITMNSTLPPLLASSTRLRDPLKRSSHSHVKHLVDACEARKAEHEKQLLIGLRRAATPTPTSSSSTTNSASHPASVDSSFFTELKRRYEKQSSHLDTLPAPLRTPDGIQRLLAQDKKRKKSSSSLSNTDGHNNNSPANNDGTTENNNNNVDENDSRAALRIPIEPLEYLAEKPRKIKLKSLHVSKKYRGGNSDRK